MIERLRGRLSYGNRWVVPLVLAGVLLATVALAPRAEAFVYWTNTGSNTVGRADLDGANANQSFITDGTGPCGVAVNSTHIFWANQGGTISRADLDGTDYLPNFITGAGNAVCGVAVNATHVFWANQNGGIGRAGLNGANPNPTFLPSPGSCGVAVNSSHLFWANSSSIGRANLDGTSANQSFITGLSSGCGVAVNSTHLFWGNQTTGTIGRADLAGTNANQSFVTGAATSLPCGVAVNATHLFWTNGNAGTVGRADLSGANPNQSFITGPTTPCGVAVDDRVTPDTEDPETTITGATISQAKRKATFRFTSSEPASTFRCKLDQQPFRSCTSPKTYRRLKPGRHEFQVRATDAAGNDDPTPAVRTFRIRR